jgi:hypothetical protein
MGRKAEVAVLRRMAIFGNFPGGSQRLRWGRVLTGEYGVARGMSASWQAARSGRCGGGGLFDQRYPKREYCFRFIRLDVDPIAMRFGDCEAI